MSYAPTARGTAAGKLAVTSDALHSPQAAALSGSATVVTIAPIGVNFGTQKVGVASAPVVVTLTNHGVSGLSISQIGMTGGNAGDFSQSNNCGGALGAGKSCTIYAVFQPTAKGARSADLSITDNGGASPQAIPMAGFGQ